jgi:hypothetical protein
MVTGGGTVSLKSIGVTTVAGCNIMLVRALKARDKIEAITATWITNETALEVRSPLNAKGSTVNIGRAGVSTSASLRGE